MSLEKEGIQKRWRTSEAGKQTLEHPCELANGLDPTFKQQKMPTATQKQHQFRARKKKQYCKTYERNATKKPTVVRFQTGFQRQTGAGEDLRQDWPGSDKSARGCE